MIRWSVEHLGEYTTLTIGLIVAIGPYIYQFIRSIDARLKYSKEDIQDMLEEPKEELGEGLTLIILLLYCLFRLIFIFGMFALGWYIMDRVNTISAEYIHNGTYDQLKMWFWN